MKITATYARKCGMPGYGSLSAGCTVEIDCKSADPDKAREAIITGYSIATAAVEEHLRNQLAALTPGPEPEPEPPDDDDGPVEFAVDPQPQPQPRPKRAPYTGPKLDHPQDGRQLLAVLRKMEEAPNASGVPDMNALVRWGKAQGFGWKVVEWGDAQTAAAYEWLLASQIERNRPPREPDETSPAAQRNWREMGRTNGLTGRRVGR